MERGGNVYSYHRDGLGSVTELSDQSGALVERYEYDVYGAPTIFDSNNTPLTASAIENPYLFTGRRYDPESGNYYYRARIYSPALGRFLQSDPLGYVDGLNLYAYVGNNPVSFVDPLGYARSDYVVNADGSVTFVGTGATISEAVNTCEDLGYENWQEGVERFADDYDAGDWWREDGSWTGKKGAYLTDKTLYPKRPPSAPSEFIEPESPICEPERPIPPSTREPEPYPIFDDPYWDDSRWPAPQPWPHPWFKMTRGPWNRFPESICGMDGGGNPLCDNEHLTKCDSAFGREYYLALAEEFKDKSDEKRVALGCVLMIDLRKKGIVFSDFLGPNTN